MEFPARVNAGSGEWWQCLLIIALSGTVIFDGNHQVVSRCQTKQNNWVMDRQMHVHFGLRSG